MNFEFVILYLFVLFSVCTFYIIIARILDKNAKKMYARKHFELTERYRNGL